MEENEVIESEPEIKTNEPRCTCNDEWPINPCPVCCEKEINTNENYGENNSTITDTNLVSKNRESFWGYKFICPKCNLDSIMHYFNYCPNCGSKIFVQSITVRNIIQKINQSAKK